MPGAPGAPKPLCTWVVRPLLLRPEGRGAAGVLHAHPGPGTLDHFRIWRELFRELRVLSRTLLPRLAVPSVADS